MQNSSNPVFKNLSKQATLEGTQASLAGISVKTVILLALMFASAAVSVIFGLRAIPDPSGQEVVFMIEPWLIAVLGVSFLTSFISVMLASFFPRIAMPFSMLYALGQGAVLGTLTSVVNFFIPGAAITALVGVGSIFVVMLLLYTSRAFRVTNRFRKVMMASMLAILLTSLFGGILQLIVPTLGIFNNLPLAIILSVVLIIFGAFMLMLDFNYAETLIEHGFPKRYEWVAALGFMVTLVWIYVQVLRLIVLLAGRRD